MRSRPRTLRAVGDLLWGFSGILLLPIPVALLYEEAGRELLGVAVPATAVTFASAAVVVAAAAGLLRWATRHAHGDIAETDAYAAIAAGWLLASLAGALPFLPHLAPLDAWFESMSGLTATGATVMAGLDATAPSLLFYRSLLQFVAGFAVIVVSLALISRLTHAGSHLLASDEGTSSTWLRANLQDAAAAVWRIYAAFGLAAFLGYLAAMRFHAGLGWKEAVLDALVHAGSTVSAGGFSSHDASVAFYRSWAVETVAIVVMLAAGTSYALLYQARRSPHRLLHDKEWRFYIGLVLAGGSVAALLLVLSGQAAPGALREAVFTVTSTLTTTGLATTDHDAWPSLARALLLLLMFSGAMAGSATGGLKILRVMLLLKVARREIRKLLHPRAVMTVRHHGRSLPEQVLLTIVAFFFAYLSIWLGGALVLAGLEDQLGVMEAAGAAAAAIGNVGPAMGIVGPFDTYAPLHPASKVVLSLMMWVGRIEVFSVLLLLSPSHWRS